MDNQKATAAEQYDTTYSLDFANTLDPVFNRATKYRYFNVYINFGIQSNYKLVRTEILNVRNVVKGCFRWMKG